MSLSIGIVGLPNVGKSTLFNAMLKRQVALAANYPFATIEPNIGIVDLPDERLNKLAEVVLKEFRVSPERIVPATVKFVDIAGLVEGASAGEGLGNQFLGHIKDVSAIVQVVRDFSDENVIREGSIEPKSDIEVINTELMLADLQTINSRIERHAGVLKKEKTLENLHKQELYLSIKVALEKGASLLSLGFSSEDLELLKDLHLLNLKPKIYVLNCDEDAVADGTSIPSLDFLESHDSHVVKLCAKIESELCSLSDEDRSAYMRELGLSESGLDVVIKTGFALLGLQTYFTAGPKEVRAWTIKKGDKAPKAAGVIHTDFEKGFIKAEVFSFEDLVMYGSFKECKARGVARIEGKDYIMQEGDVVEFRVNA
ncbi:redox-regulated ATPase YchF [Candidatus Nomurabacteria bacterium]|uniref:Ribosome-binding ATPase YchF n=1 Tax=candidate division WWE3 bacterium TaxID=2053526 RepID=A0A955E0B7_UNCKA|nr:redox-regulated ATPase YchF [candidate division WWE3 bacterium]MCB9823673.1 redox-regulated ATPase YchF [Candidatus Nomurabacteria bacterium]MCB9827249.1 redox-regulated ATPase YchF [Candidatus Nomurabacteria bacterium]MCB9827468.1 redox-regulated ATPase YchF [Candidatus Nomurabacteria bacterium]HXK52590.1 redox-regulated ATPase YchF [bacterium]